ncbi:hypothetical protein VIOR3934_07984 [Vibrio orientalis CIP 102891 = ATCC 33934]|uniref:Uncharacterized protein n=1 Tax=Vibrio orientalis CIP 102891 = ATCC 33934 TaxID=675816 RepID=F9ST20_VIBOR|nr:hypothetical protein VIOR3934_07984 [Vibrio orientalis CIP 102891 = ATCC 33934]
MFHISLSVIDENIKILKASIQTIDRAKINSQFSRIQLIIAIYGFE